MLPREAPNRTVHHGDGVAWLREHAPLARDHAIVTSLPDSSEMKLSFEAWREWFIDTAALACSAVHEDAIAIFFQSDVKRDGTWIDKSYLVQRGAERAGTALLFHTIVCRAPAGKITPGRPSYAHLLGFSKALRLTPQQASADVLPQLGAMTWARAMGIAACEATAQRLLAHTACRTVVDPFCGVGSMLAVANAYGLDAIGVELSGKRAERARTLVWHAGSPERV